MDDDVIVIAEGTNGTIMKVNEIQVRILKKNLFQ
jgi:hypothetical protein